MDHESFTPVSALIGGLLIGVATGLTLLLNGKIAGISGVLGRVLRAPRGDTAWRVFFLLGLGTGAFGAFALYPPSAVYQPMASTGLLALAGLLVGFGARLGGGCTSGHGVCGVSRGSIASILGTLTFMATGFLTVYLLHHVLELR